MNKLVARTHRRTAVAEPARRNGTPQHRAMHCRSLLCQTERPRPPPVTQPMLSPPVNTYICTIYELRDRLQVLSKYTNRQVKTTGKSYGENLIGNMSPAKSRKRIWNGRTSRCSVESTGKQGHSRGQPKNKKEGRSRERNVTSRFEVQLEESEGGRNYKHYFTRPWYCLSYGNGHFQITSK